MAVRRPIACQNEGKSRPGSEGRRTVVTNHLTRRAVGAAALLAVPVLGAPALLARPARAQASPLQFGVMPNVSPRVLLTQYQPFRAFLEQDLARPVEVVTAPGLAPFHERTVAGAYGLVVTAANLGRVAQKDAGLRPFAIYEPRIPGLLVTHRDRPVTDIGAIRGRQVAMTNPQSLVALKFVHWARAAGIRIGQDASAVHARNEDSLAQLLTGPDTPLAVMSRGEFNAIGPAVRETLVVWQQFAAVPAFLMLLGPGTPPEEARRITTCISRFPASPAARQFFELTGFRGIRAVTDADLAEVDDVVDETRTLLRGA
jgi:phosphonate transport system substrate-binding protein